MPIDLSEFPVQSKERKPRMVDLRGFPVQSEEPEPQMVNLREFPVQGEAPMEPIPVGGGAFGAAARAREPVPPGPGMAIEQPFVKALKPYAELYVEYGQPAMKWAASGMPKKDLDKFFDPKYDWADVIRDAYPMFKDPKSRIATSVLGQFPVEVAGTIAEMGTKPSTFITWGAMERLIPPVLGAVFRKLPKNVQSALIKERFIWGRKPLDLAFKELGIKKGASSEAIRRAYRKQSLRWHPDRAPAGKKIRFARQFIKKTGAYDRIKAANIVIDEAQAMAPGIPGPKAPPGAPTPPPVAPAVPQAAAAPTAGQIIPTPPQVAPQAITPVQPPIPPVEAAPTPSVAPPAVVEPPRAITPDILRPPARVSPGPAFEADVAEIKAAQQREAARLREVEERAAVRKEAAEAGPLDEGGSELVGLEGQPIQVNPDGTITLYHRTTPENLAKIQETGRFTSQEENRVFASTTPTGQAEGFGPAVAEVRVKPSEVRLEDAFQSGEVHVSVPVPIAEKAFKAPPIEAPPIRREPVGPIAEGAPPTVTGRAPEAPAVGSPLIDAIRRSEIRISLKDYTRVTGKSGKDITPRVRRLLHRKGQTMDVLAESALTPGGELHTEAGGIYTAEADIRPEDQLVEILEQEAARPRVKKARIARPRALPEKPPRPEIAARQFRKELKRAMPRLPQKTLVKLSRIHRPGETVDAFLERIRKGKLPTLTPTEAASVFKERIMKERYPPAEKAIGVTPDLITAGQKVQIKEAAKAKLFMDDEGKPSRGFHRLIKAMTDKARVKDLTKLEAEDFVDALKRLPKPTVGYKGKAVPPKIPSTMAVTAPGELAVEYKEPTVLSLLHPPEYYSQLLGVKAIVEPGEIGKTMVDLEFQKAALKVDRLGAKINKLAKTTLREKIKAKIANRQPAAIERMGELANRYEEAPAELTKQETEIFNQFREITRIAWKRQNEVRVDLDLEPIPYRKAYMRHVAKGITEEILAGKYPFPEGRKFFAEKIVAKKIFNPMEMRRMLEDEIERIFTRDIVFATKSMLWTALKEIHLSKPLNYIYAQLNYRGMDSPAYENLTPSEQRRWNKIMVIPASDRKWINNYVNTTIKGQQSETDQKIEAILKTKKPLVNLINKVLAKFGRSMSYKPIARTFSRAGRVQILGVMGGVFGGNPRQIIRNKWQLIQNLAVANVKSVVKGMMPTGELLQRVLDKSLALKAYTGVEEWPTAVMGKISKAALRLYQWSAVSNFGTSMKIQYYNTLKYFTPEYKKYGWQSDRRTGKEAPEYLYPEEERYMLKHMEESAKMTQHNYTAMGMPEIFRHKTLTPITRLQSWWMNHFFRFHQEALRRLVTGRPSWAGKDGPKLAWADRLGWFRYLLLGIPILNAMRYTRSFLFGVAPTGMPPFFQLMQGLYFYVAGKGSGDKRLTAQGKGMMNRAGKTFIPGYIFFKDWNAYLFGDKPLSELFFYKKMRSQGDWGKPAEEADIELK